MATKVTITLSEEKLSAVKALFAYSGWDWNPDEKENVAENPEVSPSSGPAIEGNADRAECPDCLCRPCVMDESHRQLWWPENPHAPSRSNNSNRKKLYKKFWTMLSHRGVWDDERYIERKSSAVRRDSRRRIYVWQQHGYKRDIMPDCVVRQVRAWYPNVDSQPYVGHLWQ